MSKKFEETIIYKGDSELEKQIHVLNELHDKFPNNGNISRELTDKNKFIETQKKYINDLKAKGELK